jgi:hypothetical protein
MPLLVGEMISAPARRSASSAVSSSATSVPFEHDVAAGHGNGHGIGAGLDAVRQDAVAGAGERGDAFDGDRRGAGAGDLGAHGDQAVGEIDDFGLARGIADHRRAAGKRCRHHHHMGGADRNLREGIARADQAALRAPWR